MSHSSRVLQRRIFGFVSAFFRVNELAVYVDGPEATVVWIGGPDPRVLADRLLPFLPSGAQVRAEHGGTRRRVVFELPEEQEREPLAR